MKDYYAILEVHPGVSLEVLNNAYRALVRKYHPDLFHSSDKAPMNARMQEINEAYNTLSNPVLRATYDRELAAWREQQPLPGTQAGPSRGATLRKMLLWGAGTYVVLRFLLRPLLVTALGKLLVLVAVAFLFVRLYAGKKR